MKRWQRILAGLAIAGVLGALTIALLPGGRAEAVGPPGVPQQEPPPTEPVLTPGSLSVTGTATATVEPDQALFDFTISALEPTASAARTSANLAVVNVIAALQDLGIATTDLRTTSISLFEEFDFSGDRPVRTGFRFSNSIRVTVRDLNMVGDVIDAAVTAGGDLISISGIQFTVSSQAAIARDVLVAAVRDALEQASLIAEAAGVTLERIVFISPFTSFGPVFAEPVADIGGGVPVFGGTQEISASVQITYEIS